MFLNMFMVLMRNGSLVRRYRIWSNYFAEVFLTYNSMSVGEPYPVTFWNALGDWFFLWANIRWPVFICAPLNIGPSAKDL